jgi:hypothetical protein
MWAAASLIAAKGERWVWLREPIVNKLAAMRGLADSFSGVIIRLALAGHLACADSFLARGSKINRPASAMGRRFARAAKLRA